MSRSVPYLCLEVWIGPMEGLGYAERAEEAGGVVRIGRQPADRRRGLENQLVLPLGPGVSGSHAEIRYEGGRLYLKDLGSTNGTYVSTHRVGAEETELRPGDVFLAGFTPVRVDFNEDPDALNPPPRYLDDPSLSGFSALAAAREVAERRGETYVDSRHLCEAVLRSGTPEVARALKEASWELDVAVSDLWEGSLMEGPYAWLARVFQRAVKTTQTEGGMLASPRAVLVLESASRAKAAVEDAGSGPPAGTNAAIAEALRLLVADRVGPVGPWLRAHGVKPPEALPVPRLGGRPARAQDPPTLAFSGREKTPARPEVSGRRSTSLADSEASQTALDGTQAVGESFGARPVPPTEHLPEIRHAPPPLPRPEPARPVAETARPPAVRPAPPPVPPPARPTAQPAPPSGAMRAANAAPAVRPVDGAVPSATFVPTSAASLPPPVPAAVAVRAVGPGEGVSASPPAPAPTAAPAAPAASFPPSAGSGDAVVDQRARELASQIVEVATAYRFASAGDRRSAVRGRVSREVSSMDPARRRKLLEQLRRHFPVAEVGASEGHSELGRLRKRVAELEKELAYARAEVSRAGKAAALQAADPSHGAGAETARWDDLLDRTRETNDPRVLTVREIVDFTLNLEKFLLGLVEEVTMPGGATSVFRLPSFRESVTDILSEVAEGREPDPQRLARYLGELQRWVVAITAAYHEAPKVWFDRIWKKISPAVIEASPREGGWKLRGETADWWTLYRALVKDLSPEVVQDQVLRAASVIAQSEYGKMKRGRKRDE